MEVRAGIVEGEIPLGAAQDDHVAILERENPSLIDRKFVLGEGANPALAAKQNGIANCRGCASR